MKQKIVSSLLALAVFLSLGLLTGCSAEESAAKTQIQAETSASAERTSTTLPTEEFHSDDWYDVHTLADVFAAGYFSGSRDILKLLLADTFEGEIDVYYDYYNAEDVAPNVISIKGLDNIGEQKAGDICYPSVEFFSGIEGDSYSYLSLTMVKQENGWKVQSYGLEK